MDGKAGMAQSWNTKVSEFLWHCHYSEQPNVLEYSLILLDPPINAVKKDFIFL